MRYRIQNKPSYFIFIVILLVIGSLTIGFAALSKNLRIQSSAQVRPASSALDVVFSTNSSAAVYGSVTGNTTGSGNIVASTATLSNTTVSNLAVEFSQPGQKVTYDFFVYNNSAFTAYLTALSFNTVLNQSSTKWCTPFGEINPASTGYDDACDDITLKITVGSLIIGESTSKNAEEINDTLGLEAGHSFPVQVEIEYPAGSHVADGEFSISFGDIVLSYSTVMGETLQGGEEQGGQTSTGFTGTIYRTGTEPSIHGTSIASKTGWCGYGTLFNSEGDTCIGFNLIFESELECQNTLSNLGATDITCYQGSINGLTNYTTNLHNINQIYYIKHTVVNDIITASYTCLKDGELEACIKGGDSSYYGSYDNMSYDEVHSPNTVYNPTGNVEVIQSLQSIFENNLGGNCSYNEYGSRCYAESIAVIAADMDGVIAGIDYQSENRCLVSNFGIPSVAACNSSIF